MKNRSENADYAQMQLRAFGYLLAVSACTALALLAIAALHACGLGGFYLLYMGLILLLLALLLGVMWTLSKRYVRPFQEIDAQLSALSSDEPSEIRLPRELAPMEQKLHALEEALEKRLFCVQWAEQQKNDLVMYLAHDIRTPLTSIIGYLSLLDEAKDMPEAQRERYTHITLDKAYRLERMINEFFEIARYSLRQIQLDRENIDLCYMLVQLTDELLPVLAKNGNTSVIQMEAEDISVYGDREKLARVFNNILKNAAAYSDPNTQIVISVEARGEAVEISFCNQGEEIAPEKLEKLFDKFYRLDEARTADAGGTGLGLAIAKEIVELHGGTVCARSGHGTVTVSVTLPAGKSAT